jgi:hypothetical protein
VASGKARFRPCRVSGAAAIPRWPRPAGAALMELDGPSRSHEPPVSLGILRVSNGRSSSGSVGFHRIPHGLCAVAGRASRVFLSRPPSAAEALERRPSWTCPLLQSARESAGTALRWFLLSWDSSAPSHRHTPSASTPRSRSSLRADAATRRLAFHPRGFAPPRWFAPRKGRGSVAPRNRSRVRRVSCVPPCRATRRRLGGTGSVPATRFTPFEDFPSPEAVPHHCGRCLPAVTVLPGSGPGRGRGPSPTATPPRRVTYTAWSLPASRRWPCPEGRGAGVP